MASVLNILCFVGILAFVTGHHGHYKGHTKRNFGKSEAEKKCGQLRPNYPPQLQNRNFTGNQGYDWTFGYSFSPVFDAFMYRVLGHTEKFFTEFFVNDFSNSKGTINYSCLKYEIADDATVFIWVFEPVTRSFNDPEPDLCDLCHGVLSRSHRLTDNAPGLPVGSDPPPALTEPKVPESCRSGRKRRY